MLSLVIMLLVFFGIAMRRFLRIRLRIWQIVCLGAIGVMLAGMMTLSEAIYAVNFNVIAYLFGVFIIGRALEESGYLESLAYRVLRRSHNASLLLLLLIVVAGIGSALLMNDTLAIIGTPLILLLTARNTTLAKPLLIALAFSVTVGSVFSPIGNPQNLLIALNSGMKEPLMLFIKHLFLPTLLCLFAVFLTVRFRYRKYFHVALASDQKNIVQDKRLALLAKVSIVMMVLLIGLKLIFSLYALKIFQAMKYDMSFAWISLVAALPILIGSKKRVELVKTCDWGTIFFFIGLFVLVQAVWDGGVLQEWLTKSSLHAAHLPVVMGVSLLLSQVISNVPMVALYLPLLKHVSAGVSSYLALAVGSTLAGNIFYTGAASNVIILHNAETRGVHAFDFWEFALLGIPLTLVCIFIYAVFLL